MTEAERMEYRKNLLKMREKMLKERAAMSEEERRHNREFTDLINAYNKKYSEGLPFQMPYTFEELKEAMEQDKPFHTWEKYKGWYGPVPDHWLL